MKYDICLITEADEIVATGHFMEVCALAKHLQQHKKSPLVFVNETIKQELLYNLTCDYQFYDDIFECTESIEKCVVVTDLRRVSNDFVGKLKLNGCTVVCIDELGGLNLACDCLINNMCDESFHRYELPKSIPLYAGPDYMIMKPEFAALHSKVRVSSATIKNIVVCMGGADTAGSTFQILDALKDSSYAITAIVGGGFAELERMKTYESSKVKILHNIPNVYDYFYDADLAFCSGGNTLYELACVGTPVATIYNNLHEKKNAEWFARNGFGIVVGQALEVRTSWILQAISKFYAVRDREQHSQCGKRLVDGEAVERIGELVIRMNVYG